MSHVAQKGNKMRTTINELIADLSGSERDAAMKEIDEILSFTPEVVEPFSIGKENKLKSFKKIKERKTTVKDRVLAHLSKGPSTRAEIATSLNLLHSSISARLNELVASGDVYEHSTAYDATTDRDVTVYALFEVKDV